MRCRPVLGLNSSAADAIGDVFRPRDGPTGKGARPRSADRGPRSLRQRAIVVRSDSNFTAFVSGCDDSSVRISVRHDTPQATCSSASSSRCGPGGRNNRHSFGSAFLWSPLPALRQGCPNNAMTRVKMSPSGTTLRGRRECRPSTQWIQALPVRTAQNGDENRKELPT
jgi:hypothetical protein